MIKEIKKELNKALYNEEKHDKVLKNHIRINQFKKYYDLLKELDKEYYAYYIPFIRIASETSFNNAVNIFDIIYENNIISSVERFKESKIVLSTIVDMIDKSSNRKKLGEEIQYFLTKGLLFIEPKNYNYTANSIKGRINNNGYNKINFFIEQYLKMNNYSNYAKIRSNLFINFFKISPKLGLMFLTYPAEKINPIESELIVLAYNNDKDFNQIFTSRFKKNVDKILLNYYNIYKYYLDHNNTLDTINDDINQSNFISDIKENINSLLVSYDLLDQVDTRYKSIIWDILDKMLIYTFFNNVYFKNIFNKYINLSEIALSHDFNIYKIENLKDMSKKLSINTNACSNRILKKKDTDFIKKVIKTLDIYDSATYLSHLYFKNLKYIYTGNRKMEERLKNNYEKTKDTNILTKFGYKQIFILSQNDFLEFCNINYVECEKLYRDIMKHDVFFFKKGTNNLICYYYNNNIIVIENKEIL